MITRRTCLKTSVASASVLALTGPAFAQSAPAARQAWEQFAATPGKLVAFRRGVRAMKARKPSDPTSWFFQGAIHAVTPQAIAEAQEIDPAVASVDQGQFWNQCPHFGQNSANFLIWHRAYLYYFERILRQASGDQTLSLPYWNYTDAARRSFPREFAEQLTDPQTQLPTNPLFDHRRELAFAAGVFELSPRALDTSRAFGERAFFGATEATGFAGGINDQNPRTKGMIEASVHDAIHFAIGGSIGVGDIQDGDASAGMMASVATAAFDPIFWIHHANIDRMWTLWDCLGEREWGNRPPAQWFGEAPWAFHDADLTVQAKPRIDWIDRAKTGVAYDSDNPVCKPLSATDPRKAGPSLWFSTEIKSAAGTKEGFVFQPIGDLGATTASLRVGPDAPSSVEILKPSEGGLFESIALPKAALLSSFSSRPKRVLLELGGVVVEGVTSVGFDVFVNLPEGAEATRSSVHFVGSIGLFGSRRGDEHHSHGPGGNVEVFDATRAVSEGVDLARFTVRIVPFDLLVSKSGDRIRRPYGVTIATQRLRVEEGRKVKL